MSKNGGSLFSFWKSVQARDAQPAASTTATPAEAAKPPPPPPQPVDPGSQPSVPICLDSSSSASSPLEIAHPPLPRPSCPPRPARVSRPKSPSSDSSDDSFPPSPVRTWRVASPPPPSPPPAPIIITSSSQSRSAQDVIRDSDDEDGDQDDSDVESLQAAIRSSQLPLSLSSLSSARSSTPPQTKRPRTNTLLVSPLPLRRAKQARVSKQPDPPRHRFDMQALLRHAQQDNAAEAAARRVSAAFTGRKAVDGTDAKDEDKKDKEDKVKIKQEKGLPSETGPATAGAFPTAMLDSMMDLGGEEDAAKGAEDGNVLTSLNKERLRRALDRTEVAAVSQQWYFFKEHLVGAPAKNGRPFPVQAAQGHWAFLQDSNMQNEMFSCGVVGFAMDALAPVTPPGQACLPDELFLWILDAVVLEPLPQLRAAYVSILARCPEQARRFVDPERLLRLFEKVGPRWESIDLSARLELVPAVHHPYPGRNWTPLRSLLVLLAALAETSLGLEAVRCATKILLRLAMDSIIEENVDLLDAYQNAVRPLVLRVPPSDWDDYCHDVCSSLYDSVQKPSLRWQVLACLPADVPACHELRRRLASAFLFADPARARQDPRRLAIGGQGLARLATRDDFVVTADTHYDDLVALINLLDVYVDDADRQTALEAGTAAAAQFDADVDELAARLQALGRSIEATSGGHVSRLESKTALDRVQIRLTHAVRTRRRGRRDIFGGSGSGSGFVDEGAPKQQDIRSFFLQQLAKKKVDRSTERCASVS